MVVVLISLAVTPGPGGVAPAVPQVRTVPATTAPTTAVRSALRMRKGLPGRGTKIQYRREHRGTGGLLGPERTNPPWNPSSCSGPPLRRPDAPTGRPPASCRPEDPGTADAAAFRAASTR